MTQTLVTLERTVKANGRLGESDVVKNCGYAAASHGASTRQTATTLVRGLAEI